MLTRKILLLMWTRYTAGERTNALAAELKITPRFLRARWVALGLHSEVHRRERENARCHPARIYALRVEGKTWDEIAAVLGIATGPKSRRMLHNRLKRYCLRAGAKMPYPTPQGRGAKALVPESGAPPSPV